MFPECQHLPSLVSTFHLHQNGRRLLCLPQVRTHVPRSHLSHRMEQNLHDLVFRRRRVKLAPVQTVSQRYRSHCVTSSLEHDHNVSGASVDLLEIQRNDVTVDFQSFGYGGIHLPSKQVWRVVRYPIAV